ncbi:AbrB/MazE/SpoVT family DNA-binding domain-containing protein [Candidatus Gribaldobacteria bacterium]|nr:AbrB/MazE/SpoVT family DNA-binding domain-containing protein [Candidatus Gribaldobacteria bacterium]
MEQIVSITSQGQLTIPKAMRALFGIKGAVKAIIRQEKGQLVVQPKNGFWNLSGSLKSDIKLNDKQLKMARATFKNQWPKI